MEKLCFFLIIIGFLFFDRSYAANYGVEFGGKRTTSNYTLPGNIGYSTNIGVEYDFGLYYKLNETQIVGFNYKTATALLSLPPGTTGDEKVKDIRYEFYYSHKFANFRPYIGLGRGTVSYMNVNSNVVTIERLGGPYGLLGIEVMGTGFASPSVGIEVINSFYSRYTFSTYGKLKLEEGSLHVDFTGGFSLSKLEKNSIAQSINEVSLGINIGKSF